MSITNELREYFGKSKGMFTDHVIAIADRIDAEHDKALNSVDDAYDSGYNVGYHEGFASADDWLAQHEDAMAEHGWIHLPKDADGEYIHVGDVVEWPDGGTFEVVGIGEGTLFYVEDGSDCADWTGASTKRHHHALTVEDVLREFTDAILEWAVKSGTVVEVGTWSDVAAEYAARLRLAEGEDA